MQMDEFAVISDIHGNPAALRAVLADIQARQIRTLIFLGDIINGVAPRESLLELLAWPGELRCIKGNAEDNVCTRDVAGFPWRDVPRWAWIVPKITWWQTEVGDELLEKICTWEHKITFDDTLMVHHSPLDLRSFDSPIDDLPVKYQSLVFHGQGLYPDSKPDFFQENLTELRRNGTRLLYIGHTHEQWLIEAGDVTVCNVGSVGMPLDGDPCAAWVSWSRNDGVELRRVEYDLEEIVALIERTTMPSTDIGAYTKMFRYARHWREFL